MKHGNGWRQESYLDSKWIYKVKLNKDGNVEKLKARLVAAGDKQMKGKNYKQTFSPLARFASVRLMISLTTIWPKH